MPIARFRLPIAVYGILVRNGHVLLVRRAGSGYRDGQLSLPAGHVDSGEDVVTALVRELGEELAVSVDRDDLRLRVVLHSKADNKGDSDYLNLFFEVREWTGNPAIAEPDKCSELVWAELARLPADAVDYVSCALEAFVEGRPLVLFGWSPAAQP